MTIDQASTLVGGAILWAGSVFVLGLAALAITPPRAHRWPALAGLYSTAVVITVVVFVSVSTEFGRVLK